MRRIGCKVSFESVLAAVREKRICISTHVPNTKYSKCSSVCKLPVVDFKEHWSIRGTILFEDIRGNRRLKLNFALIFLS